ncbi:hypothetical protein L1887_60081 [Cichorium endivia]|nr:hypothetical protein L1887_60081 [Cichorium endivia]
MRTSILPGNDGEESGGVPRCWHSAVTGLFYNKGFFVNFNPRGSRFTWIAALQPLAGDLLRCRNRLSRCHHGLSPLPRSRARHAVARSPSAESAVQPGAAPGAIAAPGGKPVAAGCTGTLPCGVVARGDLAADRHRRALGNPPALPAEAPAAAVAATGCFREPEQDPVQGAAGDHGCARSEPCDRHFRQVGGDHPGDGGRDQ